METMPFRFFNVFGPLQAAGHAYAAVIPQFVSAALEGRPLPLDGDGTQSRDFTYVGTVVRVLADAARRRVTSPQPVNLAFGGSTTLQVLIGMIEERLGHAVELERHQRLLRAQHVPDVGRVERPAEEADARQARAAPGRRRRPGT